MDEGTKRIARITLAGVALMGYTVYLGYMSRSAYDFNVKRLQPEIVQQNIIGGRQPEIYLKRDGIRYYSSIDGKEISDVVK